MLLYYFTIYSVILYCITLMYIILLYIIIDHIILSCNIAPGEPQDSPRESQGNPRGAFLGGYRTPRAGEAQEELKRAISTPPQANETTICTISY